MVAIEATFYLNMTLRQYLFTMIFATLMCWASWGFVIINVDPFETSAFGFGFFYMSLFLALIGTCSLILFFLYRLIEKDNLPLFRYVQKSFREAVLVAVFGVGFLFLQGKSWLTLWSGLILATLFVLIVSFSISLKSRPLTDNFN